MKTSIQLFVTPRKAVTIESGEYDSTGECMMELTQAAHALKLGKVKVDLISLFGDD